MTWEPKDNLSEDLIRDFEEAFWQAVKQKGTDVLEPALQYGQATAANVVDKERRSPLHFAAALNQVDLVEKLVAAGAQMSPSSSRRQNALISQIYCILRRAWCISDTPGVPATATSSSMCWPESTTTGSAVQPLSNLSAFNALERLLHKVWHIQDAVQAQM